MAYTGIQWPRAATPVAVHKAGVAHVLHALRALVQIVSESACPFLRRSVNRFRAAIVNWRLKVGPYGLRNAQSGMELTLDEESLRRWPPWPRRRVVLG